MLFMNESYPRSYKLRNCLGFAGFFPNWCDFSVVELIFLLTETKFLLLDPLWRRNSYLSSVSWVRILSGTAQGTESLVNQAKKRFERIGRAKFDVNTSEARFEPSGNFKES